MTTRAGSLALLASAGGTIMVVVASVAFVSASSEGAAQTSMGVPGVSLPLSQQSCNTDCQRRQTDCGLACDQEPNCIRRCRAESLDCVRRCATSPDGGAPAGNRPDTLRNLTKAGPTMLPTTDPLPPC